MWMCISARSKPISENSEVSGFAFSNPFTPRVRARALSHQSQEQGKDRQKGFKKFEKRKPLTSPTSLTDHRQRQARYEQRLKSGRRSPNVEISEDVVEFLVRFHWLEERDAGNRKALCAAAAMTVLRAWHIAGKPRQSHPLGTTP